MPPLLPKNATEGSVTTTSAKSAGSTGGGTTLANEYHVWHSTASVFSRAMGLGSLVVCSTMKVHRSLLLILHSVEILATSLDLCLSKIT